MLLWALLARLLRASWDVLEASGAVLGASWASRSDLLASRGPLGPSGRRLAALGGSSGGLVARCSHGNERAGGAGQRGGEGRSRSTSFPRPRIWAHFLPGRPKTLGLVHKKEPHLGLDSSGGPNYCFARSERARHTPTAASAVADSATNIHKLQKRCVGKARADITKRRLAKLMNGRDPRTDAYLGNVTVPVPRVFDDLSEYGPPIDVDSRYLNMPILTYYMAR